MTRSDHTLRITGTSRVAVRLADERDSEALMRLAALDSAVLPDGPILVAEIDGEAAAALPIAGGPVVADPFRRTAAATELLELRATQIRGNQRIAVSYRERLRALIRIPRTVLSR